jgi:hypothetical protein
MSGPYPLDASVVAAAGRQLSTNLAGEVVILGLEDGFYYGLEAIGARIWELLQTPQRVSDLVDRIVSDYDVTPATAEADLQALLEDLAARRLIDIDVPNHL